MSKLDANKVISAAPSPREALRTMIISRLRRTRDPVTHERLSLLSAQLKNGAPAAFIARQVELIGRA